MQVWCSQMSRRRHGPHDRLDGGVDAHAVARRAGLAPHGPLGDIEPARDRLDRLPLGHQSQHDELVVAEGHRTVAPSSAADRLVDVRHQPDRVRAGRTPVAGPRRRQPGSPCAAGSGGWWPPRPRSTLVPRAAAGDVDARVQRVAPAHRRAVDRTRKVSVTSPSRARRRPGRPVRAEVDLWWCTDRGRRRPRARRSGSTAQRGQLSRRTGLTSRWPVAPGCQSSTSSHQDDGRPVRGPGPPSRRPCGRRRGALWPAGGRRRGPRASPGRTAVDGGGDVASGLRDRPLRDREGDHGGLAGREVDPDPHPVALALPDRDRRVSPVQASSSTGTAAAGGGQPDVLGHAGSACGSRRAWRSPGSRGRRRRPTRRRASGRSLVLDVGRDAEGGEGAGDVGVGRRPAGRGGA